MRIAIVAEVFLPKIDGVVMRTMNLIRHLQDMGDEILVVCPEAAGCENANVDTVPVQSFPFASYPEYRIGLPNEEMAEKITAFQPDVIHYINPFAFGFRCYDRLRASQVNAPSVFSFHTLYGEFVKKYQILKPLSQLVWWLMRSYHNCASTNLTVSTSMQTDLVQRGFKRVEFWPPAVNGELFHPDRRTARMREQLSGGQSDKRLLITVSRLAPEKNVGFLADVLQQVPDVSLIVVGDGPSRNTLERKFADLDARFVGYLKGQELAEAYASADGFLYASETETLGNVVLEAMASGLPVIAPRAGGIPSFVEHGRTGLLYEPRNLEQAVDYVRQVDENTSLRSLLGATARETVASWDWGHSIHQVRDLYIKTIETQSDRPGNPASPRLARMVVSSLVQAFKLWPAKPRVQESPALPEPAVLEQPLLS